MRLIESSLERCEGLGCRIEMDTAARESEGERRTEARNVAPEIRPGMKWANTQILWAKMRHQLTSKDDIHGHEELTSYDLKISRLPRDPTI